MSIANADQRVLGYLGRGLSLELSAVQLYTTQARLVDTWGLAEVAGKLSAEASEELEHAERIITPIIAQVEAPNATQLPPERHRRELRQHHEQDYPYEE